MDDYTSAMAQMSTDTSKITRRQIETTIARFSNVKFKIQNKNNCASLNTVIWDSFKTNPQEEKYGC